MLEFQVIFWRMDRDRPFQLAPWILIPPSGPHVLENRTISSVQWTCAISDGPRFSTSVGTDSDPYFSEQKPFPSSNSSLPAMAE